MYIYYIRFLNIAVAAKNLCFVVCSFASFVCAFFASFFFFVAPQGGKKINAAICIKKPKTCKYV